MTKENAKRIVKKVIYQFIGDYESDKEIAMTREDKLLLEVNKTICNAIDSLEELSFDDCVSRKFMYELGATCIATRDKNGKLLALGTIENLPVVTPTIPKGATNGDMIKAIFPNVEIYTDVINEIVDIEICEDSSELRCSVDWWDAPYKRGSENGNQDN